MQKCVSRPYGHVGLVCKDSFRRLEIPLGHVCCMVIATTLQPSILAGQR